MKKLILFKAVLLYLLVCATTHAQEKYGNTLNIGAGIGYYGYAPLVPAITVNYEFDVAPNITIAPFVTAFTYRSYYSWGNSNNTHREYYYDRTVFPVGGKATYYFDDLFNAGNKWDFYAAGSVGFVIVSTTYESGYGGNRSVYNGLSPLYINAHIGSEFHLSKRIGLYLDLSTGLSTFGLAVHL